MSVGGAVVVKLGIAKSEMIFQRVIFGRRELAVQLVRANIGRVLVADTVLVKRLVGNRQREFTRLGGRFADGKGVLADEILGFKTDKLHDDAGFAHGMLKTLPIAATMLMLFRRPQTKKKAGQTPKRLARRS